MTQLRIRKKAPPKPRLAPVVAPMGAVLALGLAATWGLGAKGQQPLDVVEHAAPPLIRAAHSAWAVARAHAGALQGWAEQADWGRRRFEVQGRAWVLATHPPVTDFAPDEMVYAGDADGARLFANRARGLSALGGGHAYDRLYLELAPGRYAPLRWRDVPRREGGPQ